MRKQEHFKSLSGTLTKNRAFGRLTMSLLATAWAMLWSALLKKLNVSPLDMLSEDDANISECMLSF